MKPIHALAALAAVLVAGCASTPPEPAPVSLTSATPEEMVAAIDGAAGSGDAELAVQPLRDPMVEDLREQAQRARAQGRYDEAAAALDRALAIVADDPALLQERAEAALLQRDFERATGQLAERAFAWLRRSGRCAGRQWGPMRPGAAGGRR